MREARASSSRGRAAGSLRISRPNASLKPRNAVCAHKRLHRRTRLLLTRACAGALSIRRSRPRSRWRTATYLWEVVAVARAGIASAAGRVRARARIAMVTKLRGARAYDMWQICRISAKLSESRAATFSLDSDFLFPTCSFFLFFFFRAQGVGFAVASSLLWALSWGKRRVAVVRLNVDESLFLARDAESMRFLSGLSLWHAQFYPVISDTMAWCGIKKRFHCTIVRNY